mgnify:CR=1 FL=1
MRELFKKRTNHQKTKESRKMSLPRMRTIPSAVKYFKTKDPETAVNEWWLRNQIKQGQIPSIQAGKR